MFSQISVNLFTGGVGISSPMSFLLGVGMSRGGRYVRGWGYPIPATVTWGWPPDVRWQVGCMHPTGMLSCLLSRTLAGAGREETLGALLSKGRVICISTCSLRG